jgi:proteasome lid subunit RPN8/RPN11
MLSITRKANIEIRMHAKNLYPEEACGIVAGTTYEIAREIRRIKNVADNPRIEYQFDPSEQLKAWNLMEENGLVPAVIYHSHPNDDAYPSPKDIAGAAAYPNSHYVIYSVAHSAFRSFRIINGKSIEEGIYII